MTEHGTRSRYSKGCRCDDCRAASRAYHNAYYHSQRGKTARIKAGKKYRASALGKAAERRYTLSEGHIRALRKYRLSDKGRAVTRRSSKKYAAAHPEKKRAQKKVANAIKYGRLVRPNICEHCDTHVFTEASHTDYDKPLDVEWLCKPCHTRKDGRAYGS